MSVMMGALRESVSKSVAQARQAVPGGIAAMGQTAQAAIQPAVDVVKNLDHPLGEGIAAQSHDEAKFSIYLPAVRARKDAYEAAEELKSRKESF